MRFFSLQFIPGIEEIHGTFRSLLSAAALAKSAAEGLSAGISRAKMNESPRSFSWRNKPKKNQGIPWLRIMIRLYGPPYTG